MANKHHKPEEIVAKLRQVEVADPDRAMEEHYNAKRPHSALGYRPPAPETIVPIDHRPIMH